MPSDQDWIRYWCPTCNLHVLADRVHRGATSIIHIMRVPATCATCPPRGVPHVVIEQRSSSISVDQNQKETL